MACVVDLRTTAPNGVVEHPHVEAWMAAHCWGCEVAIPAIGAATGNPVGACWDCHVLGCLGHGERDSGSGKWLCIPSVATAAAKSAGLNGVSSSVTFRSVKDLEDRFPTLLGAIPRAWTPGDARGSMNNRLAELQTEPLDYALLAEAANIADFLLPQERGFQGEPMPTPPGLLPTNVLILIGRA